LWYLTINILLFAMMGIDKYKAKHHKWRIPEKTLLISALMGGFLGGFAGMYVFRHKTQKIYFHVIFTFATIIHFTALILLLYKGGFNL
jgi:uncharacterized membrane protein YsdA (DUF1294 family)